MSDKVERPEADWRERLTAEQYRVLREKGTERAFSGEYWDNHEKGRYLCAGCGEELFRSDEKFDSGTGWPSFFDPFDGDHISFLEDRAHGMTRTEIRCRRCQGHLGHVFPDGPPPTGHRYCMNSAALEFFPEGQEPPQHTANGMGNPKV